MSSTTSSVPFPPDFLCPINQTLMVDPVVAQDGNSYERSAILEWYVNHNTSPITREVVRKDLIPNIRLRSLIQEYAEANNIPLPKIIAPTHASKPFTKEDAPTISASILKTLGATYVEMTLQSPPSPSVENPQHVIAVIDTSGSMNEETQRPVSGQESLGFTRLDFVKHSLRTILAALRPTDALTLIEFNSTARTHVPFALMTAENKSRVGELLTRLYPGGGTNIYQGLKQAIEPLLESKYASYNNTILLFTDGEPTPDFMPQGGIVKATETLLKTVELPLTINTYGFGYALDTNLLHDLANLRSGSFHYIPDLTMIGTVFVNSIANLLQATMNNVNIVYDCKILNYIGSQSHIDVPNTTGPREVTLQVNTLSHAPQTHLWEITDKDLLATEGVTIPFRVTYGNYSIQHDVPLIVPPVPEIPEVAMPILLPHRYTELLDYYSKLDNERTLTSFQTNLGFFRQSILGISHPILDAILSEITADPQNPNVGQVALAVQDKETYKRWGQNHIVSLLSAHRKRICHNFKDPSVQIYATPEFQSAMTAISNLYADIPSPQPSRNNRIAAGTINMASLSLNASDGCFGPDSMVYMADGTKKPAYAIKAGDIVRSITSPIHGSKILCVVKTATNHRRTIMVKINDELSLTPYHPVIPKTFGMGDNTQQKWEFPVNLANQDIQDIPYVYNFVLQDDHRGIVVGGYMCATLGHNYYNEPVIGHPYFAHQVVVDLKAMPGFKEGLVTFDRLVALRDPVSGMICKWIMG